jgi:type I restriction enzyme M protein
MRYEEFAACTQWWGGEAREGREANEFAWKVSAKEIKAGGYNLDLTNPALGDDLAHRSPKELVDELIKTEREIMSLLDDLEDALGGGA